MTHDPRIPESEKCICRREGELWPLPWMPLYVISSWKKKRKTINGGSNKNNWCEIDENGQVRVFAQRWHPSEEKTGKQRIYFGYKVERTRCQAIAASTGVPCPRWARVYKDTLIGKYRTGKYCGFHIRNRNGNNTGETVTLFMSNYEAILPPAMSKMLHRILENPQATSVGEEVALCKVMLAKVLQIYSSKPDAFEDPVRAGVIISLSDKIAKIAKSEADIRNQLDTQLNYKQVLVLLDALTTQLIRRFGKTETPRTVLLEMLPELPWPSGVARVHGSEELIGRRGQLLLPKPQTQQKEVEIEAAWPSLSVNDMYKKDTEINAENPAGRIREEQDHPREQLDTPIELSIVSVSEPYPDKIPDHMFKPGIIPEEISISQEVI